MYKTNTILHDIDLNKLTELYNTNSLSSSRRNVKNLNKFDSETVEKILNEIILKFGLTEPEIAWTLIAGVLQIGGSNQKAGNSVTFSVGEHTLTSQQLNNIIKKITKSGTNRQLARSIADEIASIALVINLPGDLHSQMLLEYPNLSDTDKVWCSNFQTQNPNCPDLVREWLVNNYKSRFNF